MRHRSGIRKLSRATDQRLAMLRSMTCSLLKYGKIKVTITRAKEARKMAEKVIELSKRGDLSSRRMAAAIVNDQTVLKKLFAESKQRFGERRGGYTRITRVGRRVGDAAPMAMLELI